MVAPEEVKEWLEWGGSKLLALQVSSPKPKGPHTSWPDYADEWTAKGWTQERLRPPTPQAKEIVLMDEILALPGLITDITVRRIVNSRALVTPVSQRYLFSWTKIAFILHTDRKRVVRLHFSGLCEIARRLPAGQAYTIRQTLTALST